jgi:hypothetical protein
MENNFKEKYPLNYLMDILRSLLGKDKRTYMKQIGTHPISNDIHPTNTYQLMHVHCNEKLCPSKLHYLATKTQKTTHIQLLCNYPPRNMVY